MEKENILLFGGSEHARCVIDIIERGDQYHIVGIIDKVIAKGTLCQGYEVLGNLDVLTEVMETHKVHKGIIAIGDNYHRLKKAENILKYTSDFSYVSAIHPSAIIGKNVTVGEGTVMMAGVIVNNDTSIGKHCYISTKTSVGHDSIIGDFSSFGPGATTGGRTIMGRCTAVGIGANILNGRTIGSHSVIGSGALLVKDVEDYVVAYGVPAKVVRKRSIDDTYL